MLQLILQNFFSFILIISFIVFIHEFGHFFVARLCGVKIEVFSLGFGREIFGFTDKKGTRFKFCLLPFGGYVKMFGDKSAASNPDFDAAQNFSEEEKKHSFIFKNVYQRIAIVAAGPLANFLLAIAIFTFLFWINGINKTLPIVDQALENGAAFEAGVKSGDKILAINGKEIVDFIDMQKIVTTNNGEKLRFEILRDNKTIKLDITPKFQERENIFGQVEKLGMIGVTGSQSYQEKLGFGGAFLNANRETYDISIAVFNALYQLITGQRSVKELGGPIKIAQYSGKTFELGINVVFWFMALISINLGVMNLLPLPVLDGGHLVFYFYEAIFGKPLPIKVQQAAFQFGFAVVLFLMMVTTYNDLTQIFK